MNTGNLKLSFVARTALISVVVLLGSVRLAHAQADLIIATNAEIVLPSNVDAINHFYFFTVVDDGGGISTPTITNLGYELGPINQVDVYDDGEFTYATFEVSVSVNAPGPGESTSDCFTITYEGESVNPCFDVTRAPLPVPAPENIVPACVSLHSSLVRILQPTATCRNNEYSVNLLMAAPEEPSAAKSVGVPEAFRFRER